MPKYTLQELKDKSIIINCPTKTMADKVCNTLKITANSPWDEMSNLLWVYYHESKPDFFPNDYLFSPSKIIIPASEFFLEDAPESTPEPIPTEYSVLTNATESAKKQIAEFEQVLAQIKVDAMGLGTRDLARLIKALKAI